MIDFDIPAMILMSIDINCDMEDRNILFEKVARFSIMKVVFTLRSLLLSLNPDEELDANGDGCCDCIKLINKSV